jgi:hypothetical protein
VDFPELGELMAERLRASAMPHFGQSPGLSDSAPGHVGQKILHSRRGFYFSLAVTVMYVIAATIPARFGARKLRQKLFPAVLAAKIKCLAVAFGVKRRRFVHGHSADGVFGHC